MTGRNREGFGTIGQVFGQLMIAGDKPLSRESLDESGMMGAFPAFFSGAVSKGMASGRRLPSDYRYDF